MPKFYETEEFQKLNEKWRKKLEKDGFDDIEQPDGNLKRWDSFRFKVRHRDQVDEAKEVYYRYAGQFLYEFKFKCALDKKIWQLHSEGISINNIKKILNKRGKKASPAKIFNTIKKLSAEMKSHYKLTIREEEDHE